MLNKKAIGLKWPVAALALIISVGILMYASNNTSIPKIGAISLIMMKSLENGNNIPNTIEYIVSDVNEYTTETFDGHEIFKLKTFCENLDYKLRIEDTSFIDTEGRLGIADKTRNCFADEDDLMDYFQEHFVVEYIQFRNDFGIQNLNDFDLDFTSISYESLVIEEEDLYYNIIKSEDQFEVPIIDKRTRIKKQIGQFYLKPPFKIPTEYPFDEESKQVCILSRDCGATCEDVIKKYDDLRRDYKEFEIINDGIIDEDQCERYYNCETPRDDFGNTFSCDIGVLCFGQCLPFCSVRDNIFVSDNEIGQSESSLTNCVEFSCKSYMDCSETGLCGCPDPSAGIFDDACIGNDCENLHCSRDDEFESKEGITTTCSINRCNYFDQLNGHSCSSTDFCQCDFGKTSCEGDCTCIEEFTNVACGCGDSDEVSVTFPNGCAASSYTYCEAGCDSDCDKICGCSYGSECGPCGWEECPEPPPEEPPPEEGDDDGDGGSTGGGGGDDDGVGDDGIF